MNEKTKEKADIILKAMEQAAEDQRTVLERYADSNTAGKEFSRVVDGAQDSNKIYWKG